MTDLLNHAFFSWSWAELWVISFTYFLILYFILGGLFQRSCQLLEKAGFAEKIEMQAPSPGQIKREIINSLVSIIIFGFSVWPVVWLYRNEIFQPHADTPIAILKGLLLLNVWNEIHFFLVHRIMHLPFFFKNVHLVHHRSRIPTVWSVYSFHWFEALLLSTVPTILCIVFSPPLLAIALYPLNSILFNFAGHCNYRLSFLGSKEGLASRHILHHKKSNCNYGFVSGFPDQFVSWIRQNNKSK